MRLSLKADLPEVCALHAVLLEASRCHCCIRCAPDLGSRSAPSLQTKNTNLCGQNATGCVSLDKGSGWLNAAVGPSPLPGQAQSAQMKRYSFQAILL
jgi:hypothetical protein